MTPSHPLRHFAFMNLRFTGSAWIFCFAFFLFRLLFPFIPPSVSSFILPFIYAFLSPSSFGVVGIVFGEVQSVMQGIPRTHKKDRTKVNSSTLSAISETIPFQKQYIKEYSKSYIFIWTKSETNSYKISLSSLLSLRNLFPISPSLPTGTKYVCGLPFQPHCGGESRSARWTCRT